MQTLIETVHDGLEVHVPFQMAVGDLPALLPRGPRERANEDGVSALSDADLLAIILGTGLTGCSVVQLSNGLIARFGGLDGLSKLNPSAIAQHPGLGPVKALRLSAALEAGRRSLMQSLRPRPPVVTSATIADWFSSRIGWREQEELWVVSLDPRSGMRSTRRVAQGGQQAIAVTAREVLSAVLQDGGAAMILVHNHPSGDPTPSADDVEMTHRVARAGNAIGLPLIDHVVVSSSGRYASMLDMGILPIE